ncbi:hypothetical protein [Aliarcobacter butzleri]|uniref:Antitoxin VbhA domain-containing protein n=1 Tax=Aliarcobacter butzleri TaxID=28197 RepID=A0AAW6VSS5_9BACT|nr:hypothetical protein [Aliarcobacter butzleri]MCG3658326.1 hypothetical protein [Aliarcobacter butzleri]MCG3688236.1 hypothetical protein [Aliarcobacter butzleri]MCG3699500.1 hypothetical protein [Aliarcobacter butzleri]MCT7550693.1 hypothetical protein [Aliarcobacter butzleri]MCT7559292.1 hypothetical protein [Aliarcobacter butzleri]
MKKTINTTTYPEVYTLAESLAILDKYKDDLTEEQFNNIKSVISSFAIESMYLNEKDILDGIKIQKGEATADELIANQKRNWGIL